MGGGRKALVVRLVNQRDYKKKETTVAPGNFLVGTLTILKGGIVGGVAHLRYRGGEKNQGCQGEYGRGPRVK